MFIFKNMAINNYPIMNSAALYEFTVYSLFSGIKVFTQFLSQSDMYYGTTLVNLCNDDSDGNDNTTKEKV